MMKFMAEKFDKIDVNSRKQNETLSKKFDKIDENFRKQEETSKKQNETLKEQNQELREIITLNTKFIPRYKTFVAYTIKNCTK